MNQGEKMRKALSKKIRFEVFKRDKFACQYCGRSAPDIVLNVDHVNPVSNGGDNSLFNLITSCFECNAGKSDRKLSDSTLIKKQKKQMALLQEKREQMAMMFQWQKELLNIDVEKINGICDFWSSLVPEHGVSEYGKKSLMRISRKYDLPTILEAISISVNQYVKYDDVNPNIESVQLAFSKIGGICHYKKNPEESKKFYAIGIMKNRFAYHDPRVAIILINKLLKAGYTNEQIQDHILRCRNWSEWRDGANNSLESDKKVAQSE